MNRGEKGFSLIELVIVCVILVIISVIAIPNIMRVNANYKLDSAGHSVASLFQQARMQAVKNNLPSYVNFDAANRVFVTSAPGTAYASGNPDVALTNGISFQTPPNGYSAQLDAYVGGTPAIPSSLATPNMGFNARGLPCQANAVNASVCVSDNTGYEWFMQNPTGGWEAVTITPAGRIKSWRLSNTTGGNAVCGYAVCWQ